MHFYIQTNILTYRRIAIQTDVLDGLMVAELQSKQVLLVVLGANRAQGRTDWNGRTEKEICRGRFSPENQLAKVENKICAEVKTGFVVTGLSVCPDGSVFLAANDKGRVLCFDLALQPVHLVTVGDHSEAVSGGLDLGHYLAGASLAVTGPWSPGGGEMAFSSWLLVVQGGPLLTLRVSAGVMAAGHLKPLQV